jgi:hypothetical protein
MCCKSPRNVRDEHWHPLRPCRRNGLCCTILMRAGLSLKLPSPTFVSGPVLTLLLDGAKKSLMHFQLAIFVGSCGTGVDVSYAAPQVHGIVNVALHREYSLRIIFIFTQGRKNLYHV